MIDQTAHFVAALHSGSRPPAGQMLYFPRIQKNDFILLEGERTYGFQRVVANKTKRPSSRLFHPVFLFLLEVKTAAWTFHNQPDQQQPQANPWEYL